MSRSGHPPGLLAPPSGAALVGRFALSRGRRFAEHVHPTHQLAWAERGVLSISAGDTTWALPPTRALWIPAGVRHTTAAATAAAMHSLYLRPSRVPTAFARPTVLAVTPLLAALIGHLGRAGLGDAERARAEAVLFDQLVPAPVASVELALPRDERARRVADALLADPADDRGVDALARLACTSPRTLHRLFRETTGCGLGEWRLRARMRTALELLATGLPVGVVAHRVGYRTPSAFVAAFRKVLGTTPAQVFGPGGP
ncbi:MAG TPA: helix-turn-helix transcriptional regulator [Pseudonocardia sp.]|uniref:AraC family transcriptional regulator n=1 Tax=Pseudonocardia sp. TaxID=60912 RepID=UPI002B4B23FE|nr:helix-turn-helix transcriptional regulator [Pseudonocardia sp.]HLU59150.1 helix-turn-helix transcriptional regulator [Pseudonocardia sp.]